jgi:Tfp pilus assembly protein PilF
LVVDAANPDAVPDQRENAARHVVAFYQGYTRAVNGRFGDAASAFREAAELKPDWAEAHYNFGLALSQTDEHDYKEVIAAYRQSVALAPTFFDAQKNLGSALCRAGRYEEAAEFCADAVGLKPDDAGAWFNLGYAFGRTGYVAAAMKCHSAAVSLALRTQDTDILRFIGAEFEKISQYFGGFRESIGHRYLYGERMDFDYTAIIMDDPAKDLNAEAAKLGYTFESALEALRRASEAANATTRRAKAKPRGKAKVRGEAKTELTAARLKATYEILVRESDLANPKLSDEERMSRAIHLRKTYYRLRKLDPSFKDTDEQLRLATKLLNGRAYQRRKAAKLAA